MSRSGMAAMWMLGCRKSSISAQKSMMPSIPYAPAGGLGAWEYVRLTTWFRWREAHRRDVSTAARNRVGEQEGFQVEFALLTRHTVDLRSEVAVWVSRLLGIGPSGNGQSACTTQNGNEIGADQLPQMSLLAHSCRGPTERLQFQPAGLRLDMERT
ncbi:hypothetical protein OIDMADRAFT_30859 [Oidiodendron maius Zn]|uniref:Uncharacterized protein n=1 Tax=Oidiodendron maius (strain Zn) TaxID=913774 RepID=A0A0C3GT86_OIDMZ|nr:hypothetical protein OIDMADRAFT_30859 [Oidiodendron maius Zn]